MRRHVAIFLAFTLGQFACGGDEEHEPHPDEPPCTVCASCATVCDYRYAGCTNDCESECSANCNDEGFGSDACYRDCRGDWECEYNCDVACFECSGNCFDDCNETAFECIGVCLESTACRRCETTGEVDDSGVF